LNDHLQNANIRRNENADAHRRRQECLSTGGIWLTAIIWRIGFFAGGILLILALRIEFVFLRCIDRDQEASQIPACWCLGQQFVAKRWSFVGPMRSSSMASTIFSLASVDVILALNLLNPGRCPRR